MHDENEVLFENEFSYTEERLKELYKGMLNWDKRRKVNSIIIYVLLGINVVMNIIFILMGNYQLFNLLIISLILLLIVVVFRAVEPTIMAKQVMKAYQKQYGTEMDARMTFTENVLTMYDVSMGELQYKDLSYGMITSVHESENFIVLRMEKRQVMSVFKGGFTQGTVEDFRVFIMRKIKEVESEDYDEDRRRDVSRYEPPKVRAEEAEVSAETTEERVTSTGDNNTDSKE